MKNGPNNAFREVGNAVKNASKFKVFETFSKKTRRVSESDTLMANIKGTTLAQTWSFLKNRSSQTDETCISEVKTFERGAQQLIFEIQETITSFDVSVEESIRNLRKELKTEVSFNCIPMETEYESRQVIQASFTTQRSNYVSKTEAWLIAINAKDAKEALEEYQENMAANDKRLFTYNHKVHSYVSKARNIDLKTSRLKSRNVTYSSNINSENIPAKSRATEKFKSGPILDVIPIEALQSTLYSRDMQLADLRAKLNVKAETLQDQAINIEIIHARSRKKFIPKYSDQRGSHSAMIQLRLKECEAEVDALIELQEAETDRIRECTKNFVIDWGNSFEVMQRKYAILK